MLVHSKASVSRTGEFRCPPPLNVWCPDHQLTFSFRLLAPSRWKPLEASLALVGGVSEVLLETLEEEESQGLQQKSFDLGFIFDQVIPGFLADKGSFSRTQHALCFAGLADSMLLSSILDFPFLQGRSFVVASQYATALAPSLASQYLDAAVQVLENSELGVSVKLSAVRTIKKYVYHLFSRLNPIFPDPHNVLVLASVATCLSRRSSPSRIEFCRTSCPSSCRLVTKSSPLSSNLSAPSSASMRRHWTVP